MPRHYRTKFTDPKKLKKVKSDNTQLSQNRILTNEEIARNRVEAATQAALFNSPNLNPKDKRVAPSPGDPDFQGHGINPVYPVAEIATLGAGPALARVGTKAFKSGAKKAGKKLSKSKLLDPAVDKSTSFTLNPQANYRGIGSEGLEDALINQTIRANPKAGKFTSPYFAQASGEANSAQRNIFGISLEKDPMAVINNYVKTPGKEIVEVTGVEMRRKGGHIGSKPLFKEGVTGPATDHLMFGPGRGNYAQHIPVGENTKFYKLINGEYREVPNSAGNRIRARLRTKFSP